jgi:predicted nucleotidyltransferase
MSQPELIHKIVETIVQTIQPEQIILFGSRAKDTARVESDYDFMVVVREVKNEREISRRIYRALLEKKVGVAVDVVVVGLETLVRHRENPFFIYDQVLKEGKVFYDSTARV